MSFGSRFGVEVVFFCSFLLVCLMRLFVDSECWVLVAFVFFFVILEVWNLSGLYESELMVRFDVARSCGLCNVW